MCNKSCLQASLILAPTPPADYTNTHDPVNIIRHMLPDFPQHLLAHTHTVSTHPHAFITARIAAAETALATCRRQNISVVPLFLQLFIDSHIPLYTSALWTPAVTVNDIYHNRLQPEAQTPLSEISLHADLPRNTPWTPMPTDPFARCLYKTLAAIVDRPTMRHALRSIAHLPGAYALIAKCITVSRLGNYYHARFPTTPSRAMCTIRARIDASRPDAIAAIFDAATQPALAEYMAVTFHSSPYPRAHTAPPGTHLLPMPSSSPTAPSATRPPRQPTSTPPPHPMWCLDS